MPISFSGFPTSELIQGRRVLLVEDVADNQFLMKRILEKIGLEVDVAENGLSAVQKASEGTFDLVLMDVQMPEMDGIRATQELRSRGYKRPIIALTAHGYQDCLDMTMAAGCDAYLVKPVTLNELKSAIERILSYPKPS